MSREEDMGACPSGTASAPASQAEPVNGLGQSCSPHGAERGGLSYLLVKRGLYYRPDNMGYTGIRDEAGRYLESEADPDGGVMAIHEDDAPLFSPACWSDTKVRYLMRRISTLESIIRDTLWMACRYAHGRQSYAVGMYNDAARRALQLGVVTNGPEVFAIDGNMTAEMSGLSQQEFATACHNWSSPNAIRTHVPRRDSPIEARQGRDRATGLGSRERRCAQRNRTTPTTPPQGSLTNGG